jgi:CRISPR-associated protein Cmr6
MQRVKELKMSDKSIPLVRTALRNLMGEATSAHPGLLLQRGWTAFVKTDSDNVGAGGKTEHIQRICNIPANAYYTHAFERWLNVTADTKRFVHCAMKIEGRLLIGLTGGGALETGCAVSQTYGVPYLPGSSIKGAMRAWAKKNLGDPDAQNYIFGSDSDADNPTGLSGEIAFHDAWWIPDSGGVADKNKPFAEDVLTPHHSDYYGSEGETRATDLDSPVPNALIGVRGSFLFTLEGDARWLPLAIFMLKSAMKNEGIGAKTAAGYGYLTENPEMLTNWTDKLSKKTAEEQFVKATLSLNVGTGEIKATLSDSKETTAPIKGEKKQQLLANLPEDIRNGKKIKEGKLKVEVKVRRSGDKYFELLDLRQVSSS